MKHTFFFDDNTLVVSERVAAYDPGKDGNFLFDWSTKYDLMGGAGLMSDLVEVVPAIIEELETTNSGAPMSAFESPAPTSGHRRA